MGANLYSKRNSIEVDFVRNRNPQPSTARYFRPGSLGHFEQRAVVSDFQSLRGDIEFRSLLARLSPTAKVPNSTWQESVAPLTELSNPEEVDYDPFRSEGVKIVRRWNEGLGHAHPEVFCADGGSI